MTPVTWVRIIRTKSSIWTFDFKAMEFRRDPRVAEAPDRTLVRYTGEWAPFTLFSEALDPFWGRIRFRVDGVPEIGWITSTYCPDDQGGGSR